MSKAGDRTKLMEAYKLELNKGKAGVSEPGPSEKKETKTDFNSYTWIDTPFDKLKPEDWSQIVLMITKESSKVEVHSFQGAEHPIVRREKMMGSFTAKDMIVFMGTTRFRGFSLGTYASKNDPTAARIAAMIKSMNIKVPNNGKERGAGIYSPIGVIVSFSEIAISIQSHLIQNKIRPGNAAFGDRIFEDKTGYMDPLYFFLGSLASMYDPREETNPDEAMAVYCLAYDAFQDFYVSSRRDAAKAQKGGKSRTVSSAEDIEAAKKRSRSYYLLTISTYSKRCRKAWYEGEYNVKPEQGVDLSSRGDLVTKLMNLFSCTEEEIRVPQGNSRRR